MDSPETDFFFLKMDCVGDAELNAMGDGLEGISDAPGGVSDEGDRRGRGA